MSRSPARSLVAAEPVLTGREVALPIEDPAEVNRRFAGFEAELRPSGAFGRTLVRRIALLSVRLDRCVEQEAAALGERIRHARDDHDDQRLAEVAGLLGDIGKDPAASVRKLLRTPEGVDALVQSWLDLKADLTRSGGRIWTLAHAERAHHLTGRRRNDIPISRIHELSEAIRGDFSLIGEDEGRGLDEAARQGWAADRLADRIDGEVEALREHGESLDEAAFERDRDDAVRRALFDPSKEATQARKVEAEAERGLFRALREWRLAEREAAQRPAPSAPSSPEVDPGAPGRPWPSMSGPGEGPSASEFSRPADAPEPGGSFSDVTQAVADPVSSPARAVVARRLVGDRDLEGDQPFANGGRDDRQQALLNGAAGSRSGLPTSRITERRTVEPQAFALEHATHCTPEDHREAYDPPEAED